MTRESLLRRWPVWLVLLAAGGAFAMTMGARQSMGLFLSSINTSTGLGLGSISLAFAFGQLWWGLTQPFAGMAAERFGTGRVLIAGVLLVAAGTALTPFMTSTAGLIFAIGVLAAGGAGMAGPSVLMGATARLTPPERRGMATGIVNAGGSFGQFLFAPIAQTVTAAAGWIASMQTLALLALLALPAAWVLKGHAPRAEGTAATATEPAKAPAAAPEGMWVKTRRALRDRNYQMLCVGFFICGFHIAFIATHLPGVVASCNLPPEVGAWSLATVGLFNIVGSLLAGWGIGRWRMKSLLSLIYAARGVAVLIFVFTPKTEAVFLIFAATMGLTYLSTLPPTVGLVAKFFGPANVASLFGVLMLVHQLGGFLGAWLGGKAFELNANYNWMWYADILLAVVASLAHLPIREAPVQRRALAAA